MVIASPANVSNKTRHDPFGMLLVGRNWEEGSEYRFGFNTQEQDDEIYGNGNLNAALYWEFDTRLGRRWNIDPIASSWASSYLVFNGNPIQNIDKNGDKFDWFQKDSDKSVVWIDSDADWYTDVDGNSYTNLGESIIVHTSSDIKLPSDIPLSNVGVDGWKLRCNYKITGVKDADGKLSYFKSEFVRETGETFGVINGTSDVKGKTNSALNLTKVREGWVGSFEQHTEVHCIEKVGLENVFGANSVDVNVSVWISISSTGVLSLSISHGTYPSVDASIVYNNIDDVSTSLNIYSYQQCSFMLTHVPKTSALWITANKTKVLINYYRFNELNAKYATTNNSLIQFNRFNSGINLFNPSTNQIKY